jgi:hypothetical protein
MKSDADQFGAFVSTGNAPSGRLVGMLTIIKVSRGIGADALGELYWLPD